MTSALQRCIPIIVTTRSRDSIDGAYYVELGGLPDKEIGFLVSERAGFELAAGDLARVAAAVGNHPLTPGAAAERVAGPDRLQVGEHRIPGQQSFPENQIAASHCPAAWRRPCKRHCARPTRPAGNVDGPSRSVNERVGVTNRVPLTGQSLLIFRVWRSDRVPRRQ